MTIEHLNPETLHVNPAFSQGTIASAGRTLYVGGQNGTDSEGVITGDAAEQSAQAMKNVMAVLDAAGAKPSDVAKLTIYLAESVDPAAAYGAVMPVWGTQPTAVSVLKVASLGRPEALVEIEAIASLG
jgi:enamine deaminase RidA (YjgF/YER057c/UK114 family)